MAISGPLHPSAARDRRSGREVPAWRLRAARVAVLLLRWSLALEFVGAAAMKLTGSPATVALFGAVGLGQWFRYAVASWELIGAAMLTYPRTTTIGVAVLSALMVGAASTEVFVLDRLPVSSVGTLLALLVLAAVLRRGARPDGRNRAE